jgi:hypothetical protein
MGIGHWALGIGHWGGSASSRATPVEAPAVIGHWAFPFPAFSLPFPVLKFPLPTNYYPLTTNYYTRGNYGS